MEEILKPCKFCGGKAKLWFGNLELLTDCSVSCTRCNAELRHYETPELAIEAWNMMSGDR